MWCFFWRYWNWNSAYVHIYVKHRDLFFASRPSAIGREEVLPTRSEQGLDLGSLLSRGRVLCSIVFYCNQTKKSQWVIRCAVVWDVAHCGWGRHWQLVSSMSCTSSHIGVPWIRGRSISPFLAVKPAPCRHLQVPKSTSFDASGQWSTAPAPHPF
jgi:hypothetical protein